MCRSSPRRRPAGLRMRRVGQLPVRRARPLREDAGVTARTSGQILTEFIDRYRTPEKEALHHSEAERPQGFELLSRLDAFGDNVQIELRCHLDDRAKYLPTALSLELA